MCGFVAVAMGHPGLASGTLDAMRDRLAHRGPDARRSLVLNEREGFIGLGHRRLSIIDLSDAASQPMVSACGRATIVYNGEIYNYVELRDELRRAGRVFRTSSDTEVILESYLEWGLDCLTRLNGQFAFVLWDAAKRELVVARDRFGEKPVYYAQLRKGGVAIASEIKALLACPAFDAGLDHERLAAAAAGREDYFSDRTYFEGVRKLRPAHAMRLRPDGTLVELWRYWRPDFNAPRMRWKKRDLIEEFRQRFEASVRMRLRSDVRVAACLSGGLDSSSIVAVLAGIWSEAGTLEANCSISARFDDDPTISEGPQIDSVVQRTGVKPLFVVPQPGRFADEFAAMHWHHEEPGLTGSHYNEWCVMRKARESGCTVMLDGQGADEVLGGYQFYFPLYQRDLAATRQWIRMASNTVSFRFRMARRARDFERPERRFNFHAGYSIPELLRYVRNPPTHGDVSLHDLPVQRMGNLFRHQIALGLLYDMLPRQLHSADRNAMAFGVESRFPFLDYELVDWCLRLPDGALIKDGWQKYILRKALEPKLPGEVAWRVDKVGYAAPQDEWLRGPLRTWAESRLFAKELRDFPCYDALALRRAWNAHQSGAANTEEMLWRWISVGEFVRVFSRRLDVETPAVMTAR